MFFSIDGGDGTGKSTQIALFCEWLSERGHDVVTCRDPGSTPLGEAIRNLLLDRDDLPIDRRSEMLLYMAARAQMTEEVIRPALEQGKTVVSDRYLLANVVYQGHAGGLDVDTLWQVGRIATGGLTVDLAIVLDRTGQPSIECLRMLVRTFPHSVWLNPVLTPMWDYTRTIIMIRQIFPMFELSIDGLEKAVQHLMAA